MAHGGVWTRVREWLRPRSARGDGPDLEELRDRLDQAYRTQSQLLAQVRRGVAEVATSRKRVEIQLASVRREAEAAGAEAQQAVGAGDDAAARRALTRQVALEQAAGDLDERCGALRTEEDRLADTAAGLERQIEDFRLRKTTLTARYSAAQARTEIHSATAGIGATAGEIGQAMADAERHARELEATADAVDELMSEGVISRPGESADEALRRQFDEALGSIDATAAGEGGGDGPHQISQ